MIVNECYPDWNIFDKFSWAEIELPLKTASNEPVYPTAAVPTLKVLHITDIHIDLDYAYGTDVGMLD